MVVNLLTFGNLSEFVSSGQISDISLQDSDSVKVYLNEKYPQLADKKYVMAINKVVIKENAILKEFDTVAILPPFSGG
jgi:molybdopterin synthase sulfur carrier subunit